MMKSTNKFLCDFWQGIKEFFTISSTAAEPTKSIPLVPPTPTVPVEDKDIRPYSMPQLNEGDTVWIIMEDDIGVRTMLKAMCTLWNKKTLVFEDGYQGMQWVEDVREGRYDGPIPELVISNIRQPGPFGHIVCGEMRKIPELNEMAIVIATAWRLSEETSQQLAQVEIDHFMNKPLPMPNDLKVILEDVIEARRRKVGDQVGEGDVS